MLNMYYKMLKSFEKMLNVYQKNVVDIHKISRIKTKEPMETKNNEDHKRKIKKTEK